MSETITVPLSVRADAGVMNDMTDPDPEVPERARGPRRYSAKYKAQILGDHLGLLKLLFDPDSLKLLGVHVLGERAAEIVHIGQAVLAFGGTIEYFRDAVFNYPTMAEAFKVAALDGLNKLA